MFFWRLSSGNLDDARRVVEELRRKATDLRWEPVGEMIHLDGEDQVQHARLDRTFLDIGAGDTCLTPHEVVYFTATPPGDRPRQFGLAAYASHIEGENQVAPSYLGRWAWVGVVRSDDLEAARSLMQNAADLGLEITSS